MAWNVRAAFNGKSAGTFRRFLADLGLAEKKDPEVVAFEKAEGIRKSKENLQRARDAFRRRPAAT